MNSQHATQTAKQSDTDRLCPACGSRGMALFHEVKKFPVHTVLNMTTREKALTYPRGDIALGFCRKCGFISNLAFQPELLAYSTECEESQGFSPTFNTFARQTARQLVNRYQLYRKTIIEIGCGKGEFLDQLCTLGNNRGIGFDPAYVPGRRRHSSEHLTFIQDFYSEQYADYHGDLICCKMTLEHIPNPGEFVSMVRRVIGTRHETIVFFQMPDVTRILQQGAFEDIYYEHCSYFSPGSLGRVFRQSGFDLLDLRTAYDEQYLLLEARPVSDSHVPSPPLPLEDDLTLLNSAIRLFQQRYQTMLTEWQQILKTLRDHGKRVVLWGSGSKGVAFLTAFQRDQDIQYVVDINPYRQGTYMAGTGQRIVAPDFLREYQPDAVIVMNAIYCEEIQQDLVRLGLHPEMYALGLQGSETSAYV